MDGAFDVAIVDRMLPGIDGLTLVRMLKAAQVPTRVIFVTTMAGIDDRVDGFNVGGDAYLIKPFAMPELLARVCACKRMVLSLVVSIPLTQCRPSATSSAERGRRHDQLREPLKISTRFPIPIADTAPHPPR